LSIVWFAKSQTINIKTKTRKEAKMETKKPKGRLFAYFMVAAAVGLVIANTVAVKLFALGPFVWTVAIIMSPIVYILGDVITEVYGYAAARRVIWASIAANVFMSLIFAITIVMRGINPEFDPIYRQVFMQVPRIVIASIIGVWAGQFTNAFVLSRMKVLTRGKFPPIRFIVSTLFGETVDTFFFATIGFAFIVPWSVVLTMIWSAASFKTVYETVITPITYLVCRVVKKAEGVDVYDTKISYNPFKMRSRGGE